VLQLMASIVLAGWPHQSEAADLVRVAEGPFLSAGGFFIAKDKGYFAKIGIEVKVTSFLDATFAMPSMIAGELDVAFQGAAASLFNSIEKGAPVVIFVDRGNNRMGRAYTTAAVSGGSWDGGIHTLADFAKLKNKKIGVGGIGSINQYTIAMALLKAGLNPANDVQWVVNIGQPDLIKMLGQEQVDAVDVAYNLAKVMESNKWGHIIATDDQVVPGSQIGVYVVNKEFLTQRRDVLVRWTMAYLQGVKEFNAAATAPDSNEEVIRILAKNTSLSNPQLIKQIAPNWSYVSEDGIPNVQSVLDMQDLWSGRYFQLIQKKVSEKRLFDLSVVRDAKARLDRERPFGG
jgi:NitT/TauT family transport system substrate-binding protein